MKAWRKALLPCLTVLALLAAAALPPALSRAGDSRRMGVIHTEQVDTAGPEAGSLSLSRRLRLLARWKAGDRTVSAITQTLTDADMGENFRVQVERSFSQLAEAVPALAFFRELTMEGVTAVSALLRDPETGENARMLRLTWRGDPSAEVTLDGETGLVLSLQGICGKEYVVEFGSQEAFFDQMLRYLGLEGTLDTKSSHCMVEEGTICRFHTPAAKERYCLFEPVGYRTEEGDIVVEGADDVVWTLK